MSEEKKTMKQKVTEKVKTVKDLAWDNRGILACRNKEEN